mgnify:CR=1 FL=1
MGMTRRDFQLLADTIREQINRRSIRDEESRKADPNMSGYTAVVLTAWALADHLAEYNPAFNRVRFLEACGVKP